jgi:nicotinamide-nucleotide amidase
MTRDANRTHNIALLATGDEICHGDIVNSNSQEIALRLAQEGMNVKLHMVAPDNIDAIEQAMRFLLNSHQALIITGGLGPTSDDLTRYALSKVLNRPLVFDQFSWDAICARLQRFGYATPPDSNRQQALFPAGSTIIPNPNGTAAACMATLADQFIFMLPGPPPECLPMVDKTVLPTLTKAGFKHVAYHKKWLLFGVSEGKIAEELDALAKPFNCVTGYRLCYPYLEFKVHSDSKNDFPILVTRIEKAIQAHLFGNGQNTASAMLKQVLADTPILLGICDHATGGMLETAIRTPQTNKKLQFAQQVSDFPDTIPHIEIHGLNDYWQENYDVTQTNLGISLTHNKEQRHVRIDIPFRGKHVVQYAVEFICSQVHDFLT